MNGDIIRLKHILLAIEEVGVLHTLENDLPDLKNRIETILKDLEHQP